MKYSIEQYKNLFNELSLLGKLTLFPFMLLFFPMFVVIASLFK